MRLVHAAEAGSFSGGGRDSRTGWEGSAYLESRALGDEALGSGRVYGTESRSGEMSARRARARARAEAKAGARVAQIEACAVLELAGTRAERRRGGVRARARAREEETRRERTG